MSKNFMESTDLKPNRLYPALPSLKRLEFCLPVGSSSEKRPTFAESHPESLLEDKPSEEPLGSSERMKAEILVLEEQNKELLAINKKWAKEYRTMEQYYKNKVQHLKEVSIQSEEEKSDEEERENTDRRTEVAELRARNTTLTHRGQHQQEEIRRLNKALQEALLTSQQLGDGGSETPQDIWKHQAETYKDDFMKERKDREKLKSKFLELEKRYRKVHSELFAYKSQVTTTPVHCCSCTNRAKK
ncbi:TNFAIP3-interacting protein 1 [Nothobranchius furzeri]|uniref:TNFAIP3-interacting protein 1-like n=2 Tax=Nothobranchius furzeri TaxID=105023 RepID=A0A9D2Y3Y3_NOTFU|nr:TNFAIP3-interacting protein 1-like [Nothobranchius furzeri]